jgi:hypothetical protein
MNEQRQQAYVTLIQALLNCPAEEEPEILKANQDLPLNLLLLLGRS